jgi:hypothetical protein
VSDGLKPVQALQAFLRPPLGAASNVLARPVAVPAQPFVVAIAIAIAETLHAPAFAR